MRLQRDAGNLAIARRFAEVPIPSVQRGPGPAPPRTVKHPENFPTYEGWLAAFKSVKTFKSHDKAPGAEEASFDVLGEEAADPKKPAKRASDPIGPREGDEFIDHPTDAWVKANLPEELRQMAYRLPADCADIAVVLRHVWLFAHNRTERYGGFIVGVKAGETDAKRTKRMAANLVALSTANLAMMVHAYTDSAGTPLRSIETVGPLLHPGDILVWAHHEGPPGSDPDPTRPRSGGHSSTVMDVERTGGRVTLVSTLQGNQPLPKESGSKLRWTPGRRIESDPFENPKDLTIPAKGRQPEEKVWDFGDGHTTLVVAGPPKSGGDRPAAGKEGGKTVRRLVDWLPSINSATRLNLAGRFEAAMREAQAMIERGDPPAEVEGEARTLGAAARRRVAALDAALAKAGKAPDPSLLDGIWGVLAATRAATASTARVPVKKVFDAVLGALVDTVPQAGWSGVPAGDINVGERMVGRVRRIPLDGMPGAKQAIVALPAPITGGKTPVDVLLYFHGQTAGARAGRDVSVDRIEAQLEASGRRMIAVMPQGTIKADFGVFDPDIYLREVFNRLISLRIWASRPPMGAVVFSGHSAGGKVAADLLTAPVSELKGVAGITLFDGINGPEELKVAETFVGQQLDAALAQLRAKSVKGVDDKENRVLAGVVGLRAYVVGTAQAKPTRKLLDRPGLHATLRATIEAWFADHGSELSPRAARELREQFQVISTGGRDHDRIIGGPARPGSDVGALRDALSAPGP